MYIYHKKAGMIKNELYASENVGKALTVEQDDKRHATMKGLLERR